jgi:hypothetical protein
MAFPLSITGSVTVPKDDTDFVTVPNLAQGIEKLLSEAKATSVARDGNSITFTAGFFRFVINWNILVPFGSGKLEVEDEGHRIRVRYAARTVPLLVFTSSVFCAIAIWMSLAELRAGTFPAWALLWVFGVFWVWLFGMNYVIAMIRFPFWLKRGLLRYVSVAPRQTPPAAL